MDQACWICKLSNRAHSRPNPDPKLPASGAEPPACQAYQVGAKKLLHLPVSDHRWHPPVSVYFDLFTGAVPDLGTFPQQVSSSDV